MQIIYKRYCHKCLRRTWDIMQQDLQDLKDL
jgi:hypothetical protein